MGLNAMSFGQNIFTVLDFVISPACWTVEPPSSCNGSGSNGRSMRRVNWQKAVDRAATKLNRLPSQFVNKLSQWLRTLSTFVILGICQLRVAQTSSNEVPAFMQPWRAVTIGSGCLRQWSWNCTTRVYVRRYCTIWSVVQSPKIARLIPSISGACEDCLASNGINSFEIPKVQLLSGQSLLTLIIQSR